MEENDIPDASLATSLAAAEVLLEPLLNVQDETLVDAEEDEDDVSWTSNTLFFEFLLIFTVLPTQSKASRCLAPPQVPDLEFCGHHCSS